MAKGKSPWAKFGKSAQISGKGSRQEFLPSRHALAQLVHGNPAQRSINNYAKLTPSGSSAPGTYEDIQAMGQEGIDLKKV